MIHLVIDSVTDRQTDTQAERQTNKQNRYSIHVYRTCTQCITQ